MGEVNTSVDLSTSTPSTSKAADAADEKLMASSSSSSMLLSGGQYPALSSKTPQIPSTEQPSTAASSSGVNPAQLDIASLAQLFSGGAELSQLERALLEKAIVEQLATDPAFSAKLVKPDTQKKAETEESLLRAQQEAILTAQLQQEAQVCFNVP